MKQYQYLKKVLVLVTLFVVQFVAAQYEIPKKPDFQTSVYDYVNLLSSTEKSTLENKLIKYSDSTSTQIVVAIIKSTQGEYINKLAVDWAHEWGIGQKGKDNGVFLLLARDDRKITIQTGYGVEHLLTDLMSRRIIETDIIPHFKRNNYYAGLDSGTNAVFKVLTGAYKGTRQEEGGGTDFGFIIFIIFLIIFFILVTRGNRGNGGGSGRGYRDGRRNRDIFETIILSNSGRGGFGGGFGGSSGGGFGGSSGGGFGGGFGGGGFGGGGATGSW